MVIGTINNSVHQDQPTGVMMDPSAPPLPQGLGRASRLAVNRESPTDIQQGWLATPMAWHWEA